MWREGAICDAIASRTILALVYHDEPLRSAGIDP
jgi:hypothetical protein